MSIIKIIKAIYANFSKTLLQPNKRNFHIQQNQTPPAQTFFHTYHSYLQKINPSLFTDHEICGLNTQRTRPATISKHNRSSHTAQSHFAGQSRPVSRDDPLSRDPFAGRLPFWVAKLIMSVSTTTWPPKKARREIAIAAGGFFFCRWVLRDGYFYVGEKLVSAGNRIILL